MIIVFQPVLCRKSVCRALAKKTKSCPFSKMLSFNKLFMTETETTRFIARWPESRQFPAMPKVQPPSCLLHDLSIGVKWRVKSPNTINSRGLSGKKVLFCARRRRKRKLRAISFLFYFGTVSMWLVMNTALQSINHHRLVSNVFTSANNGL